MTLLYIPTIAAITTLWMTMHNFDTHGVAQDQRCYLVSCAVNYYPQVDERQLARHDASKCRSVCDSGGMCLSVGPSTADPIDCCVSQAAGRPLGANLNCRDGFIPHISDIPCDVRNRSYDHSAKLYTCCANSTAGAEKCEYRAEGEDTLFWMVRLGLWNLVIVCVVETKLRVLPRKLAWLPILWGGSLTIILYAGSFKLWGWSAVDGEGQLVHVLTALFAFIFSWWEVVTVWCPNPSLHCWYCIVVMFLFWGGAAAEWLLLGLNPIVVWYNLPTVQNAVQNGTYMPWAGPCCGCCCGCHSHHSAESRCCPPKRLTRKQKDSISPEWLLPDYTLWDEEGVEPRFSTEGGTV